MHWADVLADELLKEDKKHVLATGITPSGPIHIGHSYPLMLNYEYCKMYGGKLILRISDLIL